MLYFLVVAKLFVITLKVRASNSALVFFGAISWLCSWLGVQGDIFDFKHELVG